MRRLLLVAVVLLSRAATAAPAATRAAGAPDPYQWLEPVESPAALRWVKRQDNLTARRLSRAPEYNALYRAALTALDSASRLSEVTSHGGYLYNFWRDAAHPRGIFRRTAPAEFRQAAPRWQTVLDLDALAQSEHEPWAFGGVTWLPGDPHRCLILLSRGGGDAVEVREFDLDQLAFVPGGFLLPLAKASVSWAGPDALLVATNFGPGTLTTSGYPRIVKLWRRGTPLSAAQTLHVGSATSVAVSGRRLVSRDGDIDLITEQRTFWKARHWQLLDGRLLPLAIPETATVVDAYDGRLVLWLKRDWSFAGCRFPAGAVVVASPRLLRGGAGGIDLVVAPTPTRVVTGVDATPTGLLVTLLDDVRGRLRRYVPTDAGWTGERVELPDNGTVTVVSTDRDTGDAYLRFESFLTPPTLYFLPGRERAATGAALVPTQVKAEAPAFDGSRFAVRQFWATSADGTRIPYFVVGPKNLPHNGANPVWMFSYGGFGVPLTPTYSGSYEHLAGAYGPLWLERGGVFVLANIRGGGEFGPAWHQAAMRQNRFKAFQDFEAVARDLVARRITSPAHLGIEGRSNGGLLVASTMLRHPELYGAVVCGSPLLDMRRYTKLLAGPSWIAEYGNPDVPADWAYLSKYSPYQNVHAGMKLPPILFYTSTRDDRVDPAHARKMAAKMEALGYRVDYDENTEGGHEASVTNQELATRLAETFTFLWQHVGPHTAAAR